MLKIIRKFLFKCQALHFDTEPAVWCRATNTYQCLRLPLSYIGPPMAYFDAKLAVLMLRHCLAPSHQFLLVPEAFSYPCKVSKGSVPMPSPLLWCQDHCLVPSHQSLLVPEEPSYPHRISIGPILTPTHRSNAKPAVLVRSPLFDTESLVLTGVWDFYLSI